MRFRAVPEHWPNRFSSAQCAATDPVPVMTSWPFSRLQCSLEASLAMASHLLSTRRFLLLVLLAILIVGLISPRAHSQPQSSQASRCPTADQQRIASVNQDGGGYKPPATASQAITLTPTIGSETLEYPFGLSRSYVTKIVTLTSSAPMPIAAKDLEAAFEGDLRRTDEKQVFPLNIDTAQAAIVPEIRSDGRLVKLYVCVDSGQPNVAAPGHYQGRLAWATSKTTTAGAPLVSSGNVPVDITLQYTRQAIVWLAALLAFIVGIVVKVLNDSQTRPPPNDAGEGNMVRRSFRGLTTTMGLTTFTFWVSLLFAAGVAFVTCWNGYYGNPEFIGDFTGDLAALFAAVFAAVVAAHAGAGALSRSRQ
jgi:hypothetical protein